MWQTFVQYIEEDAEGHDSSSDDEDDDDDDEVGDAVPLVSSKIDQQVRLPSKLIWICADCTVGQAVRLVSSSLVRSHCY